MDQYLRGVKPDDEKVTLRAEFALVPYQDYVSDYHLDVTRSLESLGANADPAPGVPAGRRGAHELAADLDLDRRHDAAPPGGGRRLRRRAAPGNADAARWRSAST